MTAAKRSWKEVDRLEGTTAAARLLEEAAAALAPAGLAVTFFESTDRLAAVGLAPPTVADACAAGLLSLTLDPPAAEAGEPPSPVVLCGSEKVELRRDDLAAMVPAASVAALVGYPPAAAKEGRSAAAQHRAGRVGSLAFPATSTTFELHLARLRPAEAVSLARARPGKLPEPADTLARREEWFRKRSGGPGRR